MAPAVYFIAGLGLIGYSIYKSSKTPDDREIRLSSGKKVSLRYIWDKADTVPGRDKNEWRRDRYGNLISWKDYGKHSKNGWEIEHSNSKYNGGTDHLNNLYPVCKKDNLRKGKLSHKEYKKKLK